MSRHTAPPRANVTLALDYETLVWADAEVAKKVGATRSSVIRDCVLLGIKAVEDHRAKKAARSDPDVPFPEE